jgi:iron(III) transport system ATP-binding protein
MTSIVIERLVKRHGALAAVDGIDLAVSTGELVVLLGPSGCGKTTTLRCVAGLEDPTEGTIRIGDAVVSSATVKLPPERRSIGMVFQSYALWPHMTVAENVGFGLTLRRLPKAEVGARVADALALVGMAAYEGRNAGELSGGQQQRVALARGIVLQPQILLFDEPLSNLDAKMRERMRVEIRDLQKRLGITAVYVTHDQQEAMVIADRIVLMRAGRIEQAGAPRDIYRRPATRFAADFIGSANVLHANRGGPAGPGSVEVAPRVFLGGAVGAGSVDAVIRPEDVRLSHDTVAPGSHAGQATVKQVLFLGSVAEIELDLQGQPLRVQADPFFDLRPGAIVTAHFDPARVTILDRIP